MFQTNELYLIESFWKCPSKGGSFNVDGSIKALQYSICLHHEVKILEDDYAMRVENKTVSSFDMFDFSEKKPHFRH